MRDSTLRLGACLVLGALLGAVSPETARANIKDERLRGEASRAIDRGLKWLRAHQQDNGSWENHAGITGLSLTAFAHSPRAYREEDGPFIRRAVQFLGGLAKPDGGIYQKALPVYNTAIAVMALCSVENPELAPLIRQGRDFLTMSQTDEGEGYDPKDKFYGGIGYGNDERPDLSNLQYALEALHVTDLPGDDPTWTNAIRFIERCQNRSESNGLEWATNDGGFVYYPGYSFAGGTKSYGSMTYAGIKSFIYAHLKSDDPRVQAAFDWIRENYTLDENPGMGAQGLFYYYHTFAKTLRVYGEPEIVDGEGKTHLWADELTQVLLGRQHEDGYWVNSDSGRWWEGNKVLVTTEAILALEEAMAETARGAGCPSLRPAGAPEARRSRR